MSETGSIAAGTLDARIKAAMAVLMHRKLQYHCVLKNVARAQADGEMDKAEAQAIIDQSVKRQAALETATYLLQAPIPGRNTPGPFPVSADLK